MIYNTVWTILLMGPPAWRLPVGEVCLIVLYTLTCPLKKKKKNGYIN